jgi:copper chaperone NosL
MSRWPAALVMALVLGGVAVACGPGALEPVEPDTGHDACAHCRMIVSSKAFAGQLAAPGELPRFFDDIGCLRDFLAAQPDPPRSALAFVADHRTGRWIRAADAFYVRVDTMATPMGSHLVAYADEASWRADPEASGGRPQRAAEVFEGGRIPSGDVP